MTIRLKPLNAFKRMGILLFFSILDEFENKLIEENHLMDSSFGSYIKLVKKIQNQSIIVNDSLERFYINNYGFFTPAVNIKFKECIENSLENNSTRQESLRVLDEINKSLFKEKFDFSVIQEIKKEDFEMPIVRYSILFTLFFYYFEYS